VQTDINGCKVKNGKEMLKNQNNLGAVHSEGKYLHWTVVPSKKRRKRRRRRRPHLPLHKTYFSPLKSPIKSPYVFTPDTSRLLNP
jgi:hypothetical protein